MPIIMIVAIYKFIKFLVVVNSLITNATGADKQRNMLICLSFNDFTINYVTVSLSLFPYLSPVFSIRQTAIVSFTIIWYPTLSSMSNINIMTATEFRSLLYLDRFHLSRNLGFPKFATAILIGVVYTPLYIFKNKTAGVIIDRNFNTAFLVGNRTNRIILASFRHLRKLLVLLPI